MVLGVAFPAPGHTHDYRIGSLRIDHPLAIATPKGAKVGAGYITIINDGSPADRLIAITSPAARKVTIHTSIKEGDVVEMRPLDKGLEIKPGETVEMKPNGAHVMFENLQAPRRSRTRAEYAGFRESRQHRCGLHYRADGNEDAVAAARA